MDPDALIMEVKKEEAIWNMESKVYHNRIAKYASWTKVAGAVYDDFKNKGDYEKKILIMDIQKKWKNIRDHFRKQCLAKSDPAAITKKLYVHSNSLEFLRPLLENEETESNAVRSDASDDGSNNHNLDGEKEKPGELEMATPRAGCSNICKDWQRTEKRKKHEEIDPDKNFLLSLLPQMKRLSDDQKPYVYMDIINVINNASTRSLGTSNHYVQPSFIHASHNNSYNSHHTLQNNIPYHGSAVSHAHSFSHYTRIPYLENYFNEQRPL